MTDVIEWPFKDGFWADEAEQGLTEAELALVDKVGVIEPVGPYPEIKLKHPDDKSAADLLEHSQPISYVIKGFLPRNKVFTFTGPKGSHKTDLALHMALCVAGGTDFHGNMTTKRPGRVLFMAGENPDDVLMRLKALVWKRNISDETLRRITIMDKAVEWAKYADAYLKPRVNLDVTYDLVLMDTAQAFGTRDDINSNTEQLKSAIAFRKLTLLGGAAVVVFAHPTKEQENKSASEMVPYGGGALINEIDGLATVKMVRGKLRVSQNAKWRGKRWDDLYFDAGVINDCPSLLMTDEDGDQDQETAPFISPTMGDVEPAQDDTEWYAKLRHNQKLIVDVIMRHQMQTRSAPEVSDIVDACLDKLEADTGKRPKAQLIQRALPGLEKKGIFERRGDHLYMLKRKNPPNEEAGKIVDLKNPDDDA